MELFLSQLKTNVRILPWFWLTISSFGYAVMSFIQAPHSFKIGALIAALAWPLAGGMIAGQRIRRVLLASVLCPWVALMFFCWLTAFPENAVIIVLVGGWALAVIFALIQAGNKLVKSLYWFDVFLILAVSSWLGLILGWLAKLGVMLIQLIKLYKIGYSLFRILIYLLYN